MIPKNTIKRIQSLAQKKQRKKQNLFVAEGEKNVLDALRSSLEVIELIATPGFIQENKSLSEKARILRPAEQVEIKKASFLKTPQNSLAVCTIPSPPNIPEKLEGLALFLDGIQDPGNFGTIIRICDWFGIGLLFCSPETVDIYNPKVIQATMGSFSRIFPIYTPFKDVITRAKKSGIPVFGTFLEGENIYKQPLPSEALIVFGNEGNGISHPVAQKVQHKIKIPCFQTNTIAPESLNVAVTAGIVCSEFNRTTAVN